MFGLRLKDFWDARNDRLTLKEGRRAVFFVVNSALAAKIKDWLERCHETDRQIKAYLEPLAVSAR